MLTRPGQRLSAYLAGILLSISDSALFRELRSLFTWKAIVLVAVLFLSVILCRPFCKYLCPLGAFYALFNRISLIQVSFDPARCTHCGKCCSACGMGINPTFSPDSPECIRCGKCISSCPEGALAYSTGFACRRSAK